MSEEAAGQQEKKKGPSKKELKKLAKKAERDAKKAAAAAGGGGGGGGGGGAPASASASASTAASAPPKPLTYYLAHASPPGTAGYAATLKASVASHVFGIPLTAATGKNSCGLDDPFLHGPALLSSSGNDVAFGGNGIVKALALLSHQAKAGAEGSDSSTSTSHDNTNTATPCNNAEQVDEWLEFERTALRPALKSANAKKLDAALTQLETALSGHGNLHLVGNSTTAADVAIVVTLHTAAATTEHLAKFNYLSKYVSTHANSSHFKSGTTGVDSLLPPPPFNYQTDPSVLRAVISVFTDAIDSTFGDASVGLDLTKLVQRCKELKHGDYQCNAAMPLFQKMKQQGGGGGGGAVANSPQDVAKSIMNAIPPTNPILDSISMNGPGFITCRVKASYLTPKIVDLLRTGKVPLPTIVTSKSSKETVVVDFSSPNIAKEMHVGHLRSTIIGEAVCRILEFVGCNVKRVNHVGDWGTQFGMLIQYLKEEYPTFSEDVPNITNLTEFYKSAKKRFDEDEDFKEVSRTNVVKLQSGDEECMGIWKILCDVSRLEFQKVYARLDITVEECGESFYNDKIPPVIKEFEDAKLIKIEEGGAKCVFVPGHRVPLMLQKSDGGYGYDSTDMAALKHRLHDIGATRIVCITDFGQGDHFKMCFEAADLIGWLDSNKHRLQHIGFGTVMGEDGKRFKTRSGDTVRLVDLLDEAVDRMEKSLTERISDNKANIKKEELHKVASALGYGAVKYFDLRRNPTSNYKFSYDDMLDTKGNTAIYLLYAYARLNSICAKGKDDHGTDVDDLIKNDGGAGKIEITHPSERNLCLHLQMFADTIEDTLDDLFPYHVCDYLYSLAIAASDFITKCKVLGSPEMESRLLLCRATTIVMRQCFDLLAIRHVERI